MAEPTPAFARGSEPMIDSVDGAITFDSPRPSGSVMATTTHSGESTWNSVISNVADAARAIPAATTRLVPKRTTSFGERGANTTITAAIGTMAAPASTAEYPSTSWRYWVKRNTTPKSAR